MKIPSRIEKLITQREKLTYKLNSVDKELSNYIESNDLDVDESCYKMGAMMLVEPELAADRIRKAILLK